MATTFFDTVSDC